MPPVGFEPTISAGKRPQTYALDSTVTGTGSAFNDVQNLPHLPKGICGLSVNG